nr:hypothetical protein [Tanacetum cinerariifolium]
MSKVLQERGIRSLPGSTEPNRKDRVKSISTAKADSSVIRCIASRAYVEAHEVKILETYDHTLPQKEKDLGNFTLPWFIHNICFGKALVDLEASVSVMPFSTYSNLGLDIPEDDDVPLILGRPFLSTAYAKIDIFKRKFTLRVGEEKLVFKSIKPATSIIRRVYMITERTNLDFKIEFVREAINESFNPLYGKKADNVKSDFELVNELLKVFPKPPTQNPEATESPKAGEGGVSSTATPYPKALKKSASARLAKKVPHSEDMWETLKQVKINLPLIDAIKQILAYAKFLKDLCTQNRKLKATLPKKVDLTEHVSAVLSSSFPPKFKDPGAPLI